jgi:hypothetical protein
VYGIHNNHDHIDEGERVKGDRGWEKGEGGRMERCGRKMRETGDKAKRKKGAEGERKKKRSGRRLPPVLPLLDSGTVFVFLESQMHITPLSFEN